MDDSSDDEHKLSAEGERASSPELFDTELTSSSSLRAYEAIGGDEMSRGDRVSTQHPLEDHALAHPEEDQAELLQLQDEQSKYDRNLRRKSVPRSSGRTSPLGLRLGLERPVGLSPEAPPRKHRAVPSELVHDSGDDQDDDELLARGRPGAGLLPRSGHSGSGALQGAGDGVLPQAAGPPSRTHHERVASMDDVDEVGASSAVFGSSVGSSAPRSSSKASKRSSSRRRRRHKGTLDDLAPWQHKRLRELREAVTAEEVERAGVYNSDNHALLRFLRARNFDVMLAHQMFIDYGQWREKHHIASILEEPSPKRELLKMLVPHSHHGHDREGRPVLYEKTGRVDPGALLSLIRSEEYLRFHTWNQELLIRRCRENSERMGKHIEQFTLVVDMQGGNPNHRKCQHLLYLCSEQDKRYFPERLGRVIVINPPWIFPVLYRMVAPLIDANTKKKLTVIYGDPSERLCQLIPPDQLPLEYGGQCQCPKVSGQKDDIPGCVPEFEVSVALSRFLDLRLAASSLGDTTGKVPAVDEVNKVTHVVVAAGERFEKEYKVTSRHGGSVAWSWVTKRKDIMFYVDFTRDDDLGNTMTEYVQEPLRARAHESAVVIEMSGPFTVRLVWDNSFSFCTAKHVEFRVTHIEMTEVVDDPGAVSPNSPPSLLSL